MNDRAPLSARIGYDVVAILLALVLLAYGLLRGGGFHVAYVLLVAALALAYARINRESLTGDWRRRPLTLRGAARRMLPVVGILLAIALYGELAYDGDETGDRIVVLAGVPLAMGLASLYYSLRAPGGPAPSPTA